MNLQARSIAWLHLDNPDLKEDIYEIDEPPS
jgi:hypothetical protein